MDIKIDYMMLENVDSVFEIEKKCFNIPWLKSSFVNEILNNKLAIYVVAKKDDILIGYGGMWHILDEAHITNIAVDPDFRKIKVGTRIVSKLIEISKSKDIKRMTLEVREGNINAIKLYTKFDFKVEGKRKRYYSDNKEDALIMWKEIN